MLEVQNLSVDVDDEQGNHEILKDVSLSFSDGKLIALTGPNGGGKSTLAKTIAGIVSPSKGRILFDGTDITGESVTGRARLGIGFAFQQPVRFRGVTVRDLLSLAAGDGGAEESLCGYLKDVGLCPRDYIDREVGGQLSGGEIKRIEIATVIARGARVALFDEPEAGIDLWSFGNLIDVFRALKQRLNGTVVVITHQQRILEIADEIAVLADGAIVSVGAGRQVLPQLLDSGEGCRFCPHEPDERRACR